MTRLSIEREDPATLMEAFAITPLDDFRLTKAYTKPSIVTVAQTSGPEPMETDAIESTSSRRRATPFNADARTGHQMVCLLVES